MSSWLIFSILSPFLWSISNVVDTVLRRHHVKNDYTLMWFFSFFRWPFVAILFAIFGFSSPGFNSVIWMLIGGALWMIPMTLYLRALEKEEPSRVMLLVNTDSIFTLLIAATMIGERLGMNQALGFALIFLGGVLAAIKKTEKKFHFSKAALFIIVASFMWAFSDVIFKKYEVDFTGFWDAFKYFILGSCIVSLLFILNKKNRDGCTAAIKKLNTAGWILIFVTELTGVCGSIAFAYALTLGKASLTAVFVGIQPLFVFLNGLLLSFFLKSVERESMDYFSLISKTGALILVLLGLSYLG